VWRALVETLAAGPPEGLTTLLASALGVRDRGSGVPFIPAIGARLPGFHVTRAEPPAELWLEGAHRFARYALRFHIDVGANGSRLRAETRAEFPGFAGKAYRALVIGSRGHLVVVRLLLARVRRRARE
jgi:hypothetical protein